MKYESYIVFAMFVVFAGMIVMGLLFESRISQNTQRLDGMEIRRFGTNGDKYYWKTRDGKWYQLPPESDLYQRWLEEQVGNCCEPRDTDASVYWDKLHLMLDSKYGHD